MVLLLVVRGGIFVVMETLADGEQNSVPLWKITGEVMNDKNQTWLSRAKIPYF